MLASLGQETKMNTAPWSQAWQDRESFTFNLILVFNSFCKKYTFKTKINVSWIRGKRELVRWLQWNSPWHDLCCFSFSQNLGMKPTHSVVCENCTVAWTYQILHLTACWAIIGFRLLACFPTQILSFVNTFSFCCRFLICLHKIAFLKFIFPSQLSRKIFLGKSSAAVPWPD